MKKYFNILFALAIPFAFAACNQVEKQDNKDDQEKSDSTKTEELSQSEKQAKEEQELSDSLHFGKLVEINGALTIDEFASQMEGQDSIEVKLAAKAEDVCQTKGCWMKVKTADGSLMRVTFKDYGFFVPKNIAGKNVVLEGVAFQDTVSVEDLRHFAEDGGKSKEEIAAITEPEIAVSFVADGVVIQE